jgi:hypothetical protein
MLVRNEYKFKKIFHNALQFCKLCDILDNTNIRLNH